MKRAVCLATVAAVGAVLVGCGGGGESDELTRLSGVVTDAEGKPVAGASVSCSGRSTVSLTNGTFALTGVRSGIQKVTASITIAGRRWSGETRVDIARSARNTTVNVMVSDERDQATLRGYVIDAAGFALAGAKVFVAGPHASTLGIAEADGSYEIRRLPGGYEYTVTCSLAGYLNDTKTIRLTSGSTGNLSFALTPTSVYATIPAPTGVASQSWTIADTITRSAGGRPGYVEWLQRQYRARRNLPIAPRAVRSDALGTSRATPSGSLIEVDLFWNYREWDDLFGFAVKRGTSRPPAAVTAILRDPLAVAFFDVDSSLTPDVTYYYTVHALDTIGFPDRGVIGPASDVVWAIPLEPMAATSPAQGSSVVGDPLFRWTAVYGATTYQVVVWDRFPDLQNADDPRGAAPLWPADLSNPGASKVSAPQTSLRYSGPLLQPNRTYYWLVIAADDGEYSLSVSPLMKFVAR